MATCFTWLFLAAGGVFVVVSLIRWFEQTKDAVEHGWWSQLIMLILFPFGVWIYPSRVSAGRPSPVPHHEPIRGFGAVPTAPKAPPDADPVEQLKRKMKDQGMFEE